MQILNDKSVRLVPFTLEHLIFLHHLYQNQSFMSDFGDMDEEEKTYDSLYKWYEELVQDERAELFIIEDCKEEHAVGFIHLDDICDYEETAWISIGIDPMFQNKGYGKISMKLAIDYLFHIKKLKHCRLGVFATNTRAIYLYESIGFELEHVIPKSKFTFKKEPDIYQMILINNKIRS